MDATMEAAIGALRERHIETTFAPDSQDACRKILALVPAEATVGIGDSTTLRQLGALDRLKGRGTRVLMAHDPELVAAGHDNLEQIRLDILKEATVCDIFLTGTNALTRDGRLVNVDASGNRVAGMFWGHPLSIIVVGRNKIVADLDEAFHRIRQVIAPHHIYIKTAELGGKKSRTPCTAAAECSDCRSSGRRCNIFTIIEGKPRRSSIHVIVVDVDLGLGWDPHWPPERIQRIRDNYKKFVFISQKA